MSNNNNPDPFMNVVPIDKRSFCTRRDFLKGSAMASSVAFLGNPELERGACAEEKRKIDVDKMYGLLYFDTEDFISPPDSPAHTLPAQLADIMSKHGLQGCFHIHGERARFWEQHGMKSVIDSIKKHDVSSHYDRGSVHPTTAEEVSELDWFRGVERVLFRELPGFQSIERIFGKCSALTRHGGTFAAQIVYAVGKLGKPFFHSPFRLPGRNVVWYCNNLLIGNYQAPFFFDQIYRDTKKFETTIAKVNPYIDERANAFDFTAMFGGHPVIMIMEEFPDVINFKNGASPASKDWVAPTLIKDVSIPLILKNFERLIVTLVNHPKVEWTTVAGIHKLYGQRPIQVRDNDVLVGARDVVRKGRPTYTNLLTAGELLYLLARRVIASSAVYEVPQVMGPTEEPTDANQNSGNVDVVAIAREIVSTVMSSGYLPSQLNHCSLEYALLRLACHATGRNLPSEGDCKLSLEAIPEISEAIENVKRCKSWGIHGERYHQSEILKHFRLQCWTLKPAFTEREYASDVKLGRDLNPMFDRKI